MKATLFSLIEHALDQTVIPPQTTVQILAYAQKRAFRLFARKVTFFAVSAMVASVFIVPIFMTRVENNDDVENKFLQAKLDRLCEYTLLSVTHFEVKPITIDFKL